MLVVVLAFSSYVDILAVRMAKCEKVVVRVFLVLDPVHDFAPIWRVIEETWHPLVVLFFCCVRTSEGIFPLPFNEDELWSDGIIDALVVVVMVGVGDAEGDLRLSELNHFS